MTAGTPLTTEPLDPFAVVRRRSVAELTFGWLGRFRRLKVGYRRLLRRVFERSGAVEAVPSVWSLMERRGQWAVLLLNAAISAAR